MTPFTAYKKLAKSYPQYQFHITTGANADYFNASIYVTKDFNDLTNSFLQSNSFDKKDPVGICFKEVMQKLAAE